MSKTVNEFPDDTGQGRPAIYPWGEWMDGRIWELKQGEDFNAALKSFRVHCHKVARQNGKKVRTKFGPDGTILVCFYDMKDD